MIVTVLLVLLVLMLVGGLPVWPYSQNYGYGPSGVLGVLLILVLILAFLGRFPL